MILNNVDLNKIKCFQAVAENGGLQEGAKHLNLTTSAVYQSIKKLEEDLHLHLFYRTGKQYILTDDGKNLLQIAQNFNWDLESLLRKSSKNAQSLSGEIKLGLPLNFSKQIFIPIMKKFIDLNPVVQFFLTIAETHRLLSAVENFEVQFAITDDFSTNAFLNKIAKKQIFNEELVMICSKDFAKKHHDELKDIKTLKNLTHLCYDRTLPIIQRWYQLSYKKQVKINHFHVIDNVETMLAAIGASMGVGVVPKDLLSRQNNEFHIINLKQGVLKNHFFLVQESNFIPNILCKRFLDFFILEINK